ncbi:MAG: WYL domain-containing protein [Candidatus Kapabacteria bacterium]|nr:WYL domain-containing protein [Candidatus Kapabacteria bacterium]
MNRYWHSTQEVSDLKNGDLKLTMTAPMSPDLIAWVLSWGEGIKSAKPAELKHKLIEKHKAALRNLKL